MKSEDPVILDYQSPAAGAPRFSAAYIRLGVSYALGVAAAFWLCAYPLIFRSNQIRYGNFSREYVVMRSLKFLALGLAMYGCVCVGFADLDTKRLRVIGIIAFVFNGVVVLFNAMPY